MEISSKDSAKRALRNPPKENKTEVRKTTNIARGQFATVNSEKNNETTVTMAPTIKPRATPPKTQPTNIM